MDFGRKMEACWHPNRIQNPSQLGRTIFLKKRRFSLGKTMILKVQGTEVGSKNQSKIDEKMKSRWEGVLGSIFHRFWWVWKAKLALILFISVFAYKLLYFPYAYKHR